MSGLNKKLVEAALTAREQAHAPYSKFAVGAALQATDGRLFAGCNIENASYGLTICAERVAIFQAVANGAKRFDAIAIATRGGLPPCGACLQVMAEFERELTIYRVNVDDLTNTMTTTLNALFPSQFTLG